MDLSFLYLLATTTGISIATQIQNKYFSRMLTCMEVAPSISVYSSRNVKRKVNCADDCLRDNNCGSFIYKSSLCWLSMDALDNVVCYTNPYGTTAEYYKKLSDCKNGGVYENGVCKCSGGYIGDYCERIMEDCYEGTPYYPHLTFGVFLIKPRQATYPFYVRCWFKYGTRLYIFFNKDGGISFHKDWNEYKTGFSMTTDFTNYNDFGNLNEDSFWIGNDILHAITSSNTYDHNRSQRV